MEVKPDDALPACFSSQTGVLFAVCLVFGFLNICVLFTGVLLYQMSLTHSGGDLSSDSVCRKAVMGLLRNICVRRSLFRYELQRSWL